MKLIFQKKILIINFFLNMRRCGCNRHFYDHVQIVMDNYIKKGYLSTNISWSVDNCTKDEGPSDAFGEVLFLGYEKTSKVNKQNIFYFFFLTHILLCINKSMLKFLIIRL